MDINNFVKAANTFDSKEFMDLIFPEEWAPITARIVESGVEMSLEMCDWYPRLSPIPNTQKKGKDIYEASLKTCLYKTHDFLHQLWGLPLPSLDFTEDDFYIYKRSQMCGEVAVLTISEFLFGQYIYDNFPDFRDFLRKRCAIPMLEGPFKNKSLIEIGMRMDSILHKKVKPRWLREHKESEMFANYYVPMLEGDRKGIDNNFSLMKDNKWIPFSAPNSRYSQSLDGLELTIWMLNDFQHLLHTDDKIDYELAKFNTSRRREIKFPEGWGK
jgi:hypothetical protein